MTLILSFFAVFVLAAAVPAAGQEGFLNIDCGLEAKHGGYKDPQTGLHFVSDEPYIDGAGEIRRVSPEEARRRPRYMRTLRAFPSGVHNCYMLPTVAGEKYLFRVEFVYGNYDGRNSSSVQFDLYFGVNLWDTVNRAVRQEDEAVFVAPASWLPVCLANTNVTTPFVSYMQLIRLPREVYPIINGPGQSMSRYIRDSMRPVATGITRTPHQYRLTRDRKIKEYPLLETGSLPCALSSLETDSVSSSVSISCLLAAVRCKETSKPTYPDDIYDRFWWPMDLESTWANLSTTLTIRQEPIFKVPETVLQAAITLVGNQTNLTLTYWDDDTDKRQYVVFLHFADFQNTQIRKFNAYINDLLLRPTDMQSLFSPPYGADACVFTSDWYRADDDLYRITLVGSDQSVLPPMLNAFEIYRSMLHDNPMTFPQDLDAIMAIKLQYGIKKNWMGDPCFPTETAWHGVKCRNSAGNSSRIISLDLSFSNLQGSISSNFTLLTALKYLNLTGNQLNGPVPDSLCKRNAGSFIFRYDHDRNICNATVTSPSSSRKRTTVLAISLVAPVLALAIFVLSYMVWKSRRKANISTRHFNREPRLKKGQQSNKYNENHLQTTETVQFTYKELEKFTDKFQRLIGKGGFGPVYYGCLEDGTEVAVKIRSESASRGLDQFLAEVQSLTKVHHRNLVSLVGHCWEKNHLALFQYKGESAIGGTLSWAIRMRILLEAAQGLNYLHRGCSLPIIHRDVKTNNILLGRTLHAKIADLGLSKTFLTDTQSHMTTTAGGTIGYIDPKPMMAAVVAQLKECLALEEARADRLVTTVQDRHVRAIPVADSVASVSTFDLSGR
uniref:Protein kinase domain-containing protein n=1 Tax=Leersia perrieri TaxID=77586 RepID=A0A0D9XCS6_9ORYZ